MNRDSYTSAWGGGGKKKQTEEGQFTPQQKQVQLNKRNNTGDRHYSAAKTWQMKYFEYALAGQPCFCHMNKYPTVFKNSI